MNREEETKIAEQSIRFRGTSKGIGNICMYVMPDDRFENNGRLESVHATGHPEFEKEVWQMVIEIFGRMGAV